VKSVALRYEAQAKEIEMPLRIGTDQNDALFGTAMADLILGLAGADLIFAGAGNDFINAGTGDDYIFGGAGADIFRFNADAVLAQDHDRIYGFEVGTPDDPAVVIDVIDIPGGMVYSTGLYFNDQGVLEGNRINAYDTAGNHLTIDLVGVLDYFQFPPGVIV
jgi:Ca2+-binding RTX toxin-like protein